MMGRGFLTIQRVLCFETIHLSPSTDLLRPIDNVFLTPYQTAPLDFGSDWFYERYGGSIIHIIAVKANRRKEQIEQRLSELLASDITQEIQSV